MTVFMFIGQGVAPPWVAADVLAAPEVRELVELASDATNFDLVRTLERGGRELQRSEFLQPAMTAVCCGLVRMLEIAGVTPSLALGHSLGELSAWVATGAITGADAVRVAAIRGRLMAREAASHPGGMLRLKGDHATCERAIAHGAAVGRIWISARNAPDEWTISGESAALAAIVPQFPVTWLPVAGPWHCPAMTGALEELVEALSQIPRGPMHARFVSNRDGRIADGEDIPALLAGQLVYPVEWTQALATVVAAGGRRFIAVGPGKTLRALVYRNLGFDTAVEVVDSIAAIHCARSIDAVA